MSDRDIDGTAQDPELAARLAGINPPDHGAGFWDRVGSDLDTPGRTATRRLATGRHRPLLAAAAVIMVAAVAAGGYLAFGGDGRGDQDVITDPDPTVPADEGLPRPVGDPIDRGAGRAIAVDPTGSFLYVADTAPEGGQGCEGAALAALYVEPVDGGDRTLVADAEVIDVTTSPYLRFDTEGNVAVATQCEGFGATVHTAAVQNDGTFGEIHSTRLPDLDLGQPVETIFGLEFRRPGVLVALTRTIGDDGEESRHLYEFPAGTDDVSNLGGDGVVAISTDAEGGVLTLDNQGRISRDGTHLDTIETLVNNVRISPSGQRVVATGDDTHVRALGGPDGEHDIDLAGLVVAYLDESTAVIEVMGEGEASTAVAVDIGDPGAGGSPVDLLEGAMQMGIVVAPDLSRVFGTEMSTDGGTFTITEQRLGR